MKSVRSAITTRDLREIHLFMLLSREWDLRFETMFKQGVVTKWYSAVGNEGVTVPAAHALEPGDAVVTIHRDLGAILRQYVDPGRLFPQWFQSAPGDRRPEPRDILLRLGCQLMGKATGFTAGHDRSYHYGYINPAEGIVHVGMISHLGAMIPVATGLALRFKQLRQDRVAINFIGDGGTSTGDFHEGLNMAAVMKLPFILIIENNQYAFSTPLDQQYVSRNLAMRAEGYGALGVQVDGNNPEAVLEVMRQAVKRARRGEGPTLIEAMVGRMRGHSEGDDSLKMVPEKDLKRFMREDPLPAFESSLIKRKALTAREAKDIRAAVQALVLELLDESMKAPDPVPPVRGVFAEG
ncbi:MAG: 3-methyl-2-oxobutanoate dehydrogenase subunit alpha [Myxococcota bacterium]|nr:3-methyl-2-oxobutanoate dehydrogenase subunit alpha [Myxococcota bacterium]